MIPRRLLSRLDGRRKIKNWMMLGALVGAGLLAVAPLLLVFSFVIKNGLPALNWKFFTDLPAPIGETGGGMANAILGSLLLVAMASLIAVPWGIGTGIFLSEYGRGKTATCLRMAINLLVSVPSIIVGIFAYALIVVPMRGFSAYAGAVALAVIMIPIVAKTTEEMLKLVPEHIREAGLALGVPRWKVILRIVLKGSMSGVFTGILLAVARSMGETAPLLFTAFGNQFWSTHLDQPTASLPVQIYTYAISPYDSWHEKAWAGAFVLVLIVFSMNLFTRILMVRSRPSSQ